MMRQYPWIKACCVWWLFLIVLSLLLPLLAFADAAPDAARPYKRELVRVSHSLWGLNAPVAVFAAQIHQESAWNPNARSPVGAQGLAQFMPSTTTWISGLYADLGDKQPTNPTWAMRAMVRYDIWLWNRINAADECSRMAMALSGYNGGLGWVYKDQVLAYANGADRAMYFGQVERFNAGRHAAAFKENRGYPRNILLKWQPLYATWGQGVAC